MRKRSGYHKELSDYLGSLELQIMKDVWEHGPSTVSDVLERLNKSRRRPLAYNTVMTTLGRLADKGYLTRNRDGRAFVYGGDGPESFLRDRAAQTTRELIEGLGDVAVAGIVEGLGAVSEETRELMRRMLDEEQ